MSNDHMPPREDWEGEVFDNLEAMCAEHPEAAAQHYCSPEPNAPSASALELTIGMRSMPCFARDDGWCPRLA